MQRTLLSSAALTALLAWCPAQVAIGDQAPPPQWTNWLQGPPVALGTERAPSGTVYAFYSTPTLAVRFGNDGGYLAALQERFAARGLRVVAVVAEAGDGFDVWRGCGIVRDAQGSTTAAWLGGEPETANMLLCDHDGTVLFSGSPDAGLVDAIEGLLSGSGTVAEAKRLHTDRCQMIATFDDLEAASARERLDALLAAAPHDGVAFGLLYLAHAIKANDPAGAKRTCDLAIERLAGEPRPLAAFADLALRGDPRHDGLGGQLLPALRSAAKANARDGMLQLAFLRALVQVGDGREVARAAIRLRKMVMPSAMQCIELATILTQDHNAPVHRDLATIALDQAARLGVAPRLLTAARYGVAVRCADDPAAAAKLLDDYLHDTDQRVAINNDCWYLMTELPTMGRFDTFAAGLAERMLRERDAMDYFEFDTAALAMFLAGRADEAVKLQLLAVQKGGGGNLEYLERLERYKHAAQPAPR